MCSTGRHSVCACMHVMVMYVSGLRLISSVVLVHHGVVANPPRIQMVFLITAPAWQPQLPNHAQLPLHMSMQPSGTISGKCAQMLHFHRHEVS